MFLDDENGVRGEISRLIISPKADNKYMSEYELKESIYIPYLDFNDLYQWSFSQKRPYGGHEYEDISIFTPNFIVNYDEDSDIGYTLLVDVGYPDHLHPLHKYLPFVP